MKKLAIVVLAVIALSLSINAFAGDAEDLRAEDALLMRRIQSYNRMISQANIRRVEIQGVLKWLVKKEVEAEVEKIKAEKPIEEKETEPKVVE